VKGDEDKVSRLFNEVYEAYGGFVPRTAEYWRWSCLHRPDVREDGVFLACNGETGEVCGYAVVGLTGNVWEFCVGGEKDEAASILLREVLKYLEAAGASSVNMNVPDDFVIEQVLEREGFARVSPDRMFVSTLDPFALLSALISGKKGMGDERVVFELKDSPLGVENRLWVETHKGEMAVVKGSSQSPSIAVKTEFVTFLSVLFGVSSAYRAFLAGKIRVRPFWKAGKVLSFFSTARLKDSWFWPLSDYG
jgi:hypothetical protein